MKHENNGACAKCESIFQKFPGFSPLLRQWFADLQAKHPEAHISCAGRGEDEQEALFQKRASKAHWKESAHNWNAAIDIFENGGKSSKDIYESDWFKTVIAASLTPALKWYGTPGSKFFELPHVELADWRAMAKDGRLKLVAS